MESLDLRWGRHQTINGNRGQELSVTFRRHKTASRVKPYTVHTFVPANWVPLIRDLPRPGDLLFPRIPGRTTSELLSATLKEVDRTLEARSIRRGSLQAMATSGMPHDVIRTFSGHRSNEMLLRYLGWGAIVGRAEREAMVEVAGITA